MKKFWTTLRSVGVPLAAIVLILLTFLWYRAQTADGLKERAYEILQESAQQQVVSIRTRLDGAYTLLETVAAYAEENDAYKTPAECEATQAFMRTAVDQSAFLRIALVDQSGNAVFQNGSEISVGDRGYFRLAMEGKRAIERVESGKISDEIMFLLAVPISAGDQTAGVVFGSFYKETFAKLTDVPLYGGSTRSMICDSAGNIVVPTADDEWKKSLFDVFEERKMADGMTQSELTARLKNGENAAFSAWYNGAVCHMACVPLGVSDWYLVVSVSGRTVSETNGFVNESGAWMLAVVSIICALTIAYIYWHERNTITKLEHEKELLRLSGEQYTLVNRLSGEVLFTVDHRTGEITFNDMFETAFGFRPPKATLMQISAADETVESEDRALFERLLANIGAGKKAGSAELRMRCANGLTRWQRIEFMTVFDANGVATQSVGKITDVEKQKHAIQRLQKRADSDSLTHLFNRETMQQRVEEYLAGDGAAGVHAFLMLDADNFKQINDTMGHHEGDRVLTVLADALKKAFRSSDYLARMGGDEYAVLMKDIDGARRAQVRIDELKQTLIAFSEASGVHITVSVGVALYKQNGTTFDELYRAADAALYRAKQSGKDDVFFAE